MKLVLSKSDHPSPAVRTAVLWIILNLTHKGDPGAEGRVAQLKVQSDETRRETEPIRHCLRQLASPLCIPILLLMFRTASIVSLGCKFCLYADYVV